jgi:hypothetical protein
VHSDEFIRKCLHYAPERSYLDVIGPGDIAYIVSIIKNSNDIWDQDLRMQELGAQAISSQEKRLIPLFTSRSGQKRTQGKSLWNLEGMKYFLRAETKWRQIYDSKKDMRVLYNGWERWITTTGSDIKIGDGSKKTFKTIMEIQRKGRSRMMKRAGDLKVDIHLVGDIIDIVQIGKVISSGKIWQLKVKEKMKQKGMTLMGKMKRVHHCLR